MPPRDTNVKAAVPAKNGGPLPWKLSLHHPFKALPLGKAGANYRRERDRSTLYSLLIHLSTEGNFVAITVAFGPFPGSVRYGLNHSYRPRKEFWQAA